MNGAMYDVREVQAKIAEGRRLMVAGDEKMLRELRPGHWIGGTIPYFMTERGGALLKDSIYAAELPDLMNGATIKTYDKDSIADLYVDGPENGFSVVIFPAFSPTHFSFALNAPASEGFATRPLIGWVSGVDLAELGAATPKVFSGEESRTIDDGATVMHVPLPPDKYAEVNVVNIFRQGSGDAIVFFEDGFKATDVLVNDSKKNFVEYLAEKSVDTRLPLVADYAGAMINVSFEVVDAGKRTVSFYAPVFKGVEYKLAMPVGDYIRAFNQNLPAASGRRILFSCNCVLNYLYSGLEGKRTGEITGPMTFGEIAYQLLNQTMVYVAIGDL